LRRAGPVPKLLPREFDRGTVRVTSQSTFDRQQPSYNTFVGRERELAQLHAALDDANAGRGRLFVLSGEPGIGKTRLAEEVARESTTRGMRAVWGRSWEGGGAPAYWPWVQILRSLLVDPNRPRIRGPVVTPEVGQLVQHL
jgi:hypothetical protein